jgi:hypothetical protein
MIMSKNQNARKLIITLFCVFIVVLNALAESSNEKEFVPYGKVNATIFSNFENVFINNELTKSGFNLERAYLGYEYNLSPEWKAYVKLDVGNPTKAMSDIKYKAEDTLGIPVEVIRSGSFGGYYAYLKNGGLKFSKGAFSVDFGMIDQHLFKYQEKGWGYRYIVASFMDINKFGSSADLGAYAKYKINKNLSFDVSVSNGEGYKKPQSDLSYRVGGGFALSLFENLLIRAYYDTHHPLNAKSPVQTYVSYIEYSYQKLFKVGLEYDYQSNYASKNIDQSGISSFARYFLSEKSNIFVRYDVLTDVSNVVFSGVEYKFHKNISAALNYQGYDIKGKEKIHGIYTNFLVMF